MLIHYPDSDYSDYKYSNFFERVVFREQLLLFKILPEAQLEIHKYAIVSTILSDKLLCDSPRLDLAVTSFI